MTTAATTNSEPPWWRPAICWPWRVEWSTVPAVAPATLTPDDPLWGWFVHDLFLAEHPEGYRLDLGWYPDTSPVGAFVLELHRADEVLEQLETRDLAAIAAAILRFSRRYARPVPTSADALLAGLDSDLRRWAEGADPAAASAALAENLHHAGPVEQLLAVDLLAQQADAVAAAALLDALLIDDFFIRTTAWDGLIARTGLAPTTGADDFGPFSALHLRVLTSLKTIWHPAAARARGLFRRLLDGEAPADVIPAYIPGDPARRALALDALRQGGDAPIDLSMLRTLEGHDRAWFEAALLSRVGRQEPRAIDAAAALAISGLVGALQEAAKRWAPMSDEVRTAVARALQSVG